jgi:hypothetical protein
LIALILRFSGLEKYLTRQKALNSSFPVFANISLRRPPERLSRWFVRRAIAWLLSKYQFMRLRHNKDTGAHNSAVPNLLEIQSDDDEQ